MAVSRLYSDALVTQLPSSSRNGVYQVYVEIDGKVVPYVAVDSATGDYHG